MAVKKKEILPFATAWVDLESIMLSEISQFDSQSGARAWLAGSAPGQGECERQPIDVSLSHRCFSPSLPPFLYL